MSISRGEAYVFYASVCACLREITELIESGKVTNQDLSVTISELSAIKNVLERDEKR